MAKIGTKKKNKDATIILTACATKMTLGNCLLNKTVYRPYKPDRKYTINHARKRIENGSKCCAALSIDGKDK